MSFLSRRRRFRPAHRLSAASRLRPIRPVLPVRSTDRGIQEGQWGVDKSRNLDLPHRAAHHIEKTGEASERDGDQREGAWGSYTIPIPIVSFSNRRPLHE